MVSLMQLKRQAHSGFISNHELIIGIINYLSEFTAPDVVEAEEPFISLREFCNSLIRDGKMILFPQNVGNWIRVNPDYFQGCFNQRTASSPFKVRPKELLKKLKSGNIKSAILKKFLEEERKHEQSIT